MPLPKQPFVLDTAFNQDKLDRVLGEGGAGRIWYATDTGWSDVAIKILMPERATAEKRKRFKNEILFCQRSNQPHIIQVIDYGNTRIGSATTPFYVIPLLEASFRDRMAATHDIARRLAYFDQLLSGVEAARLQGVVHRDLKPENVLYDPSRDVVVVSDFEIAHFTDDELYTSVETAAEQG